MKKSAGATSSNPAETEPQDTELARAAAMDFNLLVPLLAVIEEQSVTRAAQRVGLSQPAMSHALRRIRRMLKDDILIRRGNESLLTPRAKELLGPLKHLVRQSTTLVHEATFEPGTSHREITLALSTSTALVAGSDICRGISERAPNCTLRMITTANPSDSLFTQDNVDAILLPEAFTTSHPRERLYDDRWVVISGSSALTNENALELLATLPHVMFDAPRISRPYQALHEHGVEYSVRTRINDNLLIPHLVSGRDLIALHRRSTAELMDPVTDIHVAEFPLEIPSLGVDIVWNPWLQDDPFRQWLGDTLKTATASGYAH